MGEALERPVGNSRRFVFNDFSPHHLGGKRAGRREINKEYLREQKETGRVEGGLFSITQSLSSVLIKGDL